MGPDLQLFFELINPYTSELTLSNAPINFEKIFRLLEQHRMEGLAYSVLLSHKMQCYFPKRFLELLRVKYQNNIRHYEFVRASISYLAKLFPASGPKYGFLKGAYLIPEVYLRGQRTCNDIDILVNSSDVSVFQRILQNNGFVQGHYQRETDTIITATRREVINSRLNYGETIPFIKRFGDSNTILEVDINFTVDYQARDKNGIVRQLLNHLDTYVINDSLVPTLNKVGFLIHLCCHLYKEATVWDWMDKSAEIYKYCDIFVFISKFGNDKFYSEFLKAAKQLGLEKECYFL